MNLQFSVDWIANDQDEVEGRLFQECYSTVILKPKNYNFSFFFTLMQNSADIGSSIFTRLIITVPYFTQS